MCSSFRWFDLAAPGVTPAALHAALLAADSATAVLERLCGGTVGIRRLPLSGAQPACLTQGGLRHRSVELVCGGRLLSVADLWFRPDCLTADMVRALEQTDTPFGRVVRDLALRRRLLAWRMEPAALEHRALLETASGEAVAEVHERYGRGLLTG